MGSDVASSPRSLTSGIALRGRTALHTKQFVFVLAVAGHITP